MLKIEGVCAGYKGLPVLNEVCLQVEKGETVALIGANSAGKTTLLKTIVGLIKPKSGKIFFHEQDVTRLEPHDMVNRGVVLVPEGKGIFVEMSVEENLLLASQNFRAKLERKSSFQLAYGLFPALKEKKNCLAGTLSGGQQQMLAVARGLMARPEILLLDEPSLGIAPILVRDIFGALKELNSHGLTILLVEQNAQLAMATCQRAYVLLHGKIEFSGLSCELLSDDRVKTAYLGLVE